MTEQYHLDKINETCCLIFVVHNKDLKLKIVIKYYCVNCLRLIRLLIKTKANNVFIFLPHPAFDAGALQKAYRLLAIMW